MTTAGPSSVPLGGLRVVELSTGIAGGYAGKLFNDAGATVLKVEPPGGDPLRRRIPSPGAADACEPGPLFRFLAAGKHAVDGDIGWGELDSLIAAADLVIQTGRSDRAVDPARHPDLVVLSLSPWGTTGPWADRPASDLVLQAESGSLHGRGPQPGTPYAAGGDVNEFAAGAYGAAAALAVLLRRRRGGAGAHVDVSLAEVSVVTATAHVSLARDIYGRPPGRAPRYLDRPAIERARDGWVGMTALSTQQMRSLCELMGRPDLAERDELGFMPVRLADADFNEALDRWLADHTVDEVLQATEAARVPSAPIGNGDTVPGFPHFVDRQLFRRDTTGMLAPRPPYRIEGMAPWDPGPVPEAASCALADAHRIFESAPPLWAPQWAASGDGRLPLEGLTILDLTSWWAGPTASHLLASLGADAVHVEGASRPDPVRVAAAFPFRPQPGWCERSNIYQAINTNKRGITLDLDAAEGLDLLRRLITASDVVMENFTPRVMPGWGLDWDGVRRLNRRAVMVRMPAFGLHGPWRDKPGFAQTIEQVSGMAWVTGTDRPSLPRGICDPLAGAHAAFATLVALAARHHDGDGRLVEVPMVESALNATAEQAGWRSLGGDLLQWRGNRGFGLVVQDLFPAAGDDEWVAVSVTDDDQLAAAGAVVGAPPDVVAAGFDALAVDPSTAAPLLAAIGRWMRDRDAREAADELAAAGVPAGRAVNTWELTAHPQLGARGLFEEHDHPVIGPLDVPGLPVRLSGVDRWTRRRAPVFGEHNAEILASVGVTPEQLEALAAKGVVATEPPS